MNARPGEMVKMHGQPDIGASRYLVLYIAQLGWIVIGAALYARAIWPSACQPDTMVKLFSCSIHLPDNRGWMEAALATWLWATPMLVVLELIRRLRKPRRR